MPIARTDTDQFLLDALAPGPRLATDVEAEAASVGISAKQLRSARERLSVEISREGDRRSRWSLPAEAPQPSTAEGSRRFIDDRVALGEWTAAKATVGRFVVNELAGGSRSRDEVEALAREAFIDEELLASVLPHLVIRGGLIGGARAAETWTL